MHEHGGHTILDDPDALLTIADVAALYGVRPATIRAWLCRGDPRLPRPIRYGRSYTRFRAGDIRRKLRELADPDVVRLQPGRTR